MPQSSLLIRDIDTLVLMDAADTVLHGAYLYAEDGEIRQVGTRGARLPRAEEVVSGRHMVAIPGLVNTHHHLYQTLTRAWAPAANAELFDWLRALYPVWARIDEESVHAAALARLSHFEGFDRANPFKISEHYSKVFTTERGTRRTILTGFGRP